LGIFDFFPTKIFLENKPNIPKKKMEALPPPPPKKKKPPPLIQTK